MPRLYLTSGSRVNKQAFAGNAGNNADYAGNNADYAGSAGNAGDGFLRYEVHVVGHKALCRCCCQPDEPRGRVLVFVLTNAESTFATCSVLLSPIIPPYQPCPNIPSPFVL